MSSDSDSRRPSQFSLRTFLIVISVLGVGSGFLGRLFLSDPAAFNLVTFILFTAGPFLAAVGTIIWTGARARRSGLVVWGTLLLVLIFISMGAVASLGSVFLTEGIHGQRLELSLDDWKVLGLLMLTFLTPVPFLLAIGTIIWTGDRRLVVWGVLLLLLPFIGWGVVKVTTAVEVRARETRGMGLQEDPSTMRTSQLIGLELPKQIDNLYLWAELEKRLASKSLSQEEVDDAVKALVANMATVKPNGYHDFLHELVPAWERDFLKSAWRASGSAPPVLLSLCDAFYGTKPVVSPLPKLAAGDCTVPIQVNYGNPLCSQIDDRTPWSSQFGPDIELAWQVNRVLLDGEPLVFHGTKAPEVWVGSCDAVVAAGQHEVTVEIECAYADPTALAVWNRSAPLPKQIPNALKQWTQSVSAPLTITEKGT